VILFIVLAEAQDSNVIPLDLLPRQCPVCQDRTIIGHGRRLRDAHDDQHERIWVRRGIWRGWARARRNFLQDLIGVS
jgi:hypothetical protein